MNLKLSKIIDHITLILTIISIIGALFYRFFNLNILNIYLISTISFAFYLIIVYFLNKINIKKIFKQTNHIKNKTSGKVKYLRFFLSFTFLILWYSEFLILFNSQTAKSIISPWQIVPSCFFFIILLSALILIILIFYKSKFNLLFIALFIFLFNSVAIIIYKFGFGFDFFIHQATMELINAAGSVEPKPFYYLGQYSLVIILHKLLFIPIYYLHLFLVPALASFLIPINLYQVLEEKFSSKTNIFLSILFTTSLPLGFFFNTTPQNLAYLFLILVILRGLICRNHFDIIYIFTLSLSALFIQPIAGIPALLLSSAITVHHSDFKKNIKKYLNYLLFILSAVSLPMAFILLNKINNSLNSNTNYETDNIFENIFEKISIHLPQQENIILNFIYFIKFNINYLFIFLFALGAYTIYKNKNKFQIYKNYLLISFGFFISFIITSNLSFNYLINYERLAFSKRIFIVSMLLLAPFFIIGIFSFISQTRQKKKSIQFIFLAFTLLLIPTFLYINYPRLDNYHNSHGYSVGQDDIDAVHYIEEKNNKNNYIVLANQQTSVASLREFGFKKYYKTTNKEEIFYYPIPTGGPLYQYFLKMVNNKPSRKTILQAMDLANVDTGYFVINKYWWASSKIIEEAKIEADSWKSINNGNIYIFEYNKG